MCRIHVCVMCFSSSFSVHSIGEPLGRDPRPCQGQRDSGSQCHALHPGHVGCHAQSPDSWARHALHPWQTQSLGSDPEVGGDTSGRLRWAEGRLVESSLLVCCCPSFSLPLSLSLPPFLSLSPSFPPSSGETPSHTGWAETPHKDSMAETPTPHGGKRKKSRWDETPASQRMGGQTPLLATPSMGTPAMGATPNFSGVTPAGTILLSTVHMVIVG